MWHFCTTEPPQRATQRLMDIEVRWGAFLVWFLQEEAVMNRVVKMNYDFTRTRAALAEYDAYSDLMDRTEYWQSSTEHVLATFGRLEYLARKVGRAFGEDTSAVNNPDMCEGCVRPSPWLRKTVAL